MEASIHILWPSIICYGQWRCILYGQEICSLRSSRSSSWHWNCPFTQWCWRLHWFHTICNRQENGNSWTGYWKHGSMQQTPGILIWDWVGTISPRSQKSVITCTTALVWHVQDFLLRSELDNRTQPVIQLLFVLYMGRLPTECKENQRINYKLFITNNEKLYKD